MQWGFGAPVSGPLSGAKDLARITQEGEKLGYDYCTLSDHVVIPRELENKYPYSDTGECPRRARAVDRGPLCRRQDLEAAAGHRGHGGAAPARRAHCENPGDDRCAVRR